jgi:hypothetical protein
MRCKAGAFILLVFQRRKKTLPDLVPGPLFPSEKYFDLLAPAYPKEALML